MGLFVIFFFCFGDFLETGDGLLWSKLVVVRNVDDDDSMFGFGERIQMFMCFDEDIYKYIIYI